MLLNIEIVENLYKNSELVNIMLEEFSNPMLLEEHVDQENFVDIITSMAHEDGFIILNIFDDAMRYFKIHFKTFVTKLTYAQQIMF